jgi:hypothetical protein
MKFFKKVLSKFGYLIFRVILWILHLFVRLLIINSFLFEKQNPKYSLALFPYSQKGSDGYKRRFEEYFSFLDKDGVRYKVFDLCSDKHYLKHVNQNIYISGYFYMRIFVKRIFQVLQIRHYKTAFIHRNLFPFYPDQKIPILERLAYKLCQHVVIDYWDSVWLYNPELNKRTVKYCHKISVVNDFILQHYKNIPVPKVLFSIGVNLDKYHIKKDYTLKTANTLTFFYTGQPHNVKKMVDKLKPVFFELSKILKIKMILVSRESIDIPNVEVKHHIFSEETFFDLLVQADIGIYAIDNTDISKGKMAMKILDYAAAGLPAIASPYGVTPFAINERNILFAETKTEWQKGILSLYNSYELRQSIGSKARIMMEKHHSLLSSYENFKAITAISD